MQIDQVNGPAVCYIIKSHSKMSYSQWIEHKTQANFLIYEWRKMGVKVYNSTYLDQLLYLALALP